MGSGNTASEPYEDGQRIVFDLKQERGKLNFGKKTAPELRALLNSQPAIVHYHHDRLDRPVIAIFILKPSDEQIEEYIESTEGFGKCSKSGCRYKTGYARETVNCPGCGRPNTVEVQPYLFSPADSARDALKSDYQRLGAHLVAHGHLGIDGFEVDLFEPDGGLSLEEGGRGEGMLLRIVAEEQCPDLCIPPLALGDDEDHEDFVARCIHGFYRDILPYLDCANMARNLIGGTLAEHLRTLVNGGKGA